MGFFDKLKNMKDEYDRKENARQQALAEEHQRRQQAKAEQERALYEKVENSDLIREVLNWITTKEGFEKSQGSLDTNRRQILVGDSLILLNNYPTDILAEHISRMGISNGKPQYWIQQKNTGILDEINSERKGTISRAERYNEKIKQQLETFSQNKYLYVEGYSLDEHGYEHIEESILRKFATVLHNKLQMMYPYATFTEVRWNTYCAYVFEMLLPPKEKKSIF